MVVAILMREETGPPGTNEIYIPGWHSRDSSGSSRTRGSCWTWLFALGAINWGRSGAVCTDNKVLPEFLNPERGLEKRWILILQLQH